MKSAILRVELAARDVAALEALRARAGLATDADVVRVALWRLAHHFDVNLDPSVFALGTGRRAGARHAKT